MSEPILQTDHWWLTLSRTDYTARDTLEQLILSEFPNPHALPAAVCMSQLTRHGFQSMGLPSEEFIQEANKHPFLSYAHDAWASHALASIGHEGTRCRLATFVEECRSFPIFLNGWGGWFDVLSPLHVTAYFNLPISFAGPSSLQDPNHWSPVGYLSPLHLATLLNSDRAVEELLALPNILVNATDRCKTTAFILASADNREGIVKLLLAHPKININHADENGMTALM